MVINTGSSGSGGGVETVVGTISAGKYGVLVRYSDGNSYVIGSWGGPEAAASGSITVLKNSIIDAFSDAFIQISGGISQPEGNGTLYFVSGDFSLSQ